MAERLGKTIDWFTCSLYLALMGIGWLMIYTVEYNPDSFNSLGDFFRKSSVGKQSVWILISLIFFITTILLDKNFWKTFAYPIYAFGLLLLLSVLLFGVEVKGATSWFRIGGFTFQPSEIAKVTTNLALASYLGAYSTNLKNIQHQLISIGIIGIPILLILFQPDAGSAIVFLSLFIVLYREGFPAIYFLAAISLALLFILGLRFDAIDISLAIAFLLNGFLLYNNTSKIYWILIVLSIEICLFFLFRDDFVIYSFYTQAALFGLLTLFAFRKKNFRLPLNMLAIFAIGCGVTFLSHTTFDALKPHQQDRINVWLNPSECDEQGSLYNLIQSKLAIGSGGLEGKGFLKGDLTKGNYVPEQVTDFIFCTIGEEQGFIGSFAIIALFVLLILRVLKLAERQKTTFARAYAYGVASILFIHFFINIGMTMGLAPVIGIPLPFISKGGSSLLGFSILIGILLKLDRHR